MIDDFLCVDYDRENNSYDTEGDTYTWCYGIHDDFDKLGIRDRKVYMACRKAMLTWMAIWQYHRNEIAGLNGLDKHIAKLIGRMVSAQRLEQVHCRTLSKKYGY